MDIKAIGHAPNNSRCDCERIDHCPNGDCKREAVFLVEYGGHKMKMCPVCFRHARMNSVTLTG